MAHKIKSLHPKNNAEFNVQLLGDCMSLCYPIQYVKEDLGIIAYELKSEYFDVDRMEFMCETPDGKMQSRYLKMSRDSMLINYN
jgi:hypothetical protein